MPNYTPTAEDLAALGYAPDVAYTWHQLHGYSRKVPEASGAATVVVQVNSLNGLVYLTLHRQGQKAEELWPCYPLPTPLFFQQLLRAMGWPLGPPLPVVPEATAELMLLRWIAYNPEKAYQYRHGLQEQAGSILDWCYQMDLLKVTRPEPYPVSPHPAAVPGTRGRPGLIEPTTEGFYYLHARRAHRETPEKLPAIITKTTNKTTT